MHPSKTDTNPFPCYLCNEFDDGVLHVFQDCPITRASLLLVFGDIDCPPLGTVREKLINHSGPLFSSSIEVPVLRENDLFNFTYMSFLVVFCSSVWTVVSKIKKGIMVSNYAIAIANEMIKNKRHWCPPPRSSASNLGSSAGRSKSQKEAANKYAEDLISQIPTSCVTVYTDGSSWPTNPGPSGAGALVTMRGRPDTRLLASIGHGTNNLGEAWAIGMALSFLLRPDRLVNLPSKYIVILTDSKLCVDALKKGFSKNNALDKLIQLTLTLINTHPQFTVKLCWIPEHAGVPGNEIADELAGLDARGAPVDFPSPLSFVILDN